MPRRPEIASSPYRLAESYVLIGVIQTPRGPQPLFAQVSGEQCVVAYTDPEEIQADLPDGYRTFQIQVVELMQQTPPHAGLVIDPRAPSPIFIPAADRERLLAAGTTFPAGASVTIGLPADPPDALMRRARQLLEDEPGLRRLWAAWYQVADAQDKLLVVYDVEPGVGADVRVANAIVQAARETGYPHPMRVTALDDIPDGHRAWLLEHVPPAYVHDQEKPDES